MTAGPRKRNGRIDALRAVALLGIAVAHASLEYGAPTSAGYGNRISALDVTVGRAIEVLTYGKFFTIFSFLFGYSFGWQQNGKRFMRRALLLAGLGFVHSLFYIGDILSIYAVLCPALWMVRRWPVRRLVWVGTIFALALPWQAQRVWMYAGPQDVAQVSEEKVLLGRLLAEADRQAQVQQTGSLAEVVVRNAGAGQALKWIFQVLSGRLGVTLGLFLLGLAAHRAGWFEDREADRRRWTWMLGMGVPLSVAMVGLWWWLALPLVPDLRTGRGLVGVVLNDVLQITASAVYVAAVMLAHEHVGGRVREWLEEVGKMSLSVYLLQSVVGLSLFYGWGAGWSGKLGVLEGTAKAVALQLLVTGMVIWWRQGRGVAEMRKIR